jgi:NAD kinase
VCAPIAPVMFQTLTIAQVVEVVCDEPISIKGPCVLAFDGERERVVKPEQKVHFRLSRSGPKILDIEKTMQLAAGRQLFTKLE